MFYHQLLKSSVLEDYLTLLYTGAAQYNRPPRYPFTVVCGGIDGASHGNDTLSKIFAGVVAYRGNKSCYVNAPKNKSETDEGWRWQTCSDMVMPIGISNDSMFPANQFDLKEYVELCKAQYGVPPRPHWATTYFGGHDTRGGVIYLHNFSNGFELIV
ncbi:unnamed protein product [Prunus armeniaca]